MKSDSVRQFPAGRCPACDYIRCGIAALLAAVPYIKHSRYGIFTGFLQKVHINYTGHVEDHCCFLKIPGYQTEQFFFPAVKTVAVLPVFVILGFSCRSSDNHQGFVGMGSRVLYQILRYRHFLLVQTDFPVSSFRKYLPALH